MTVSINRRGCTIKLSNVELRQFMSQTSAVNEVRRAIKIAMRLVETTGIEDAEHE